MDAETQVLRGMEYFDCKIKFALYQLNPNSAIWRYFAQMDYSITFLEMSCNKTFLTNDFVIEPIG